jgi:HEAT repeat protein
MAVVAVAGLFTPGRSFALPPDEWGPVMALVEKIKAEPAVNPRTDQAEKLAVVVRRKKGHAAPKNVIRALADLMADRDDSVRYWVAGALGFLGPQAAGAIPALQTALTEIEGKRGSKTSESAIRLALKRIGAPSK